MSLHIKEGAIITPSYFTQRSDSGLEDYVGKVMKPAKDVVLDFGNGTTRAMVVYDDGIFMDTGKLMTIMKSYLGEKVTFKQQRIENFSTIQDNVIVNCTGIGSKKLLDDDKMVSVQGHLIMLKDQVPENLNQMILIYLGSDKTKIGQKIKRSFYIFPKHSVDAEPNDIGVIGGTFVEGADGSTPNLEEFDIMIKNAKEFYGVK